MRSFCTDDPEPTTSFDIELGSRTARIQRLALRFPTLRGANGIYPWSIVAFAEWVSAIDDPAAKAAGQFLIELWNHGTPPEQGWWNLDLQVGRFHVVTALQIWDAHHRAAYLNWVEQPFWP